MMKQSSLLWMGIVLTLIIGMCSCSSDDEMGTTNYDALFDVSYYDQDPSQDKRQGYWFGEEFIELTPQKEPPFILIVKWDSDIGKNALDYIVSKNDGVVQNRHNYQEDNTALIVCNKYISCPYFYVSSSYKSSKAHLLENEYCRVDNRIILKMKEGMDVEIIEHRYADVLIRYIGDEQLKGMEIFDCKLKSSCEVLQMAEEINQRDDVEWAEPNMSFPIHFN